MQPCHEKVKRQRGPIILAILEDLSTMICAKIRPWAYLVLEKKRFEGFTIYEHGFLVSGL